MIPQSLCDSPQGHADHSLCSDRAAPLLRLFAKVSLTRMLRRCSALSMINRSGLFRCGDSYDSCNVIICFCCLIRKTTFFTDGHSVILSSDQRESSDDIVREMFADVVEGDIAECSSSADAGRGCIGTID